MALVWAIIRRKDRSWRGGLIMVAFFSFVCCWLLFFFFFFLLRVAQILSPPRISLAALMLGHL